MSFNFFNSGFNFFELVRKYEQFKTELMKSGRDPSELLNEQLKRRNISGSELENLKQSARILSQILGGKL